MTAPGFGIIHRAGCNAEMIAAAMPLATMAGRGPIETVADGRGGELFRCLVCGALEGEPPPDPEREAILVAFRELRAQSRGGRPRQVDLARKLVMDERTLRRELTKHGLPWPPET